MSTRTMRFWPVTCAVLIFAAGMMSGACAQSARTSAGTRTATGATQSKVVMKVGNVQVTQGDIDFLMNSLNPQEREQVEKGGRRSIGEQYATLLVLSQAALSKHLDSSAEFKKAMEQHRTQLLAELEYQNLARNAAVSQAEVSQYYSSHASQFEEAQIREVAVRKKTEGSTQGLSSEEAHSRAETIRKALASGEDVQKVAHDYGVPNQVIVQTATQTVQNTDALPAWVRTAFQLKDGQVSDIQDTPNVVVFFQVVSHPKLDFKQAAPEIENALRQQKVQAAVAGLKKTTPVWMDQTYFSSGSAPTK